MVDKRTFAKPARPLGIELAPGDYPVQWFAVNSDGEHLVHFYDGVEFVLERVGFQAQLIVRSSGMANVIVMEVAQHG